MSSTRLEYLFNRACQQEASVNELAELQAMLDAPQYEKQLVQLMSTVIECPPTIKGMVDDRLKEKTLQAIFNYDQLEGKEDSIDMEPFNYGKVYWYKTTFFKYAVASCLVLALVLLSWFQFQERADMPDKSVAVTDVQSNSHGAVLTLADGTVVVLDSIGEGIVAEQPGSEVALKNGILTYNKSGKENSDKAFNTITTTPGRQFQLKLPDGTMVWINAASSITYPSQFNTTTREVSVSGEVYFEVAANRNIPFLVNIDKQTQVQVTGTRFNVHAYANDAVKTTLIEGAVVVKHAEQLQHLRPGQQAWIAGGRPLQLKQGVNLDQVMAWKKGLFDFSNQDIRSVMNEIGRWYDLRIFFEGEPGNIEIVGEIERNLSLQQLLNILKRLGVKCRLENKNLFVMP